MSIRAVYFQIPIVLSAFLLFLVQPIIAKQILPWFGGSASVWNTCIFFFQLLLLGGYLYAHGLVRFASPKTQAIIHVAMLALCVASLPVVTSDYWKSGETDPAVRILLMLATTVGLPYFILSSTSPLLQAWFARTMAAPYKLFALSNAASLGRAAGVSLSHGADPHDHAAGVALVHRLSLVRARLRLRHHGQRARSAPLRRIDARRS